VKSCEKVVIFTMGKLCCDRDIIPIPVTSHNPKHNTRDISLRGLCAFDGLSVWHTCTSSESME